MDALTFLLLGGEGAASGPAIPLGTDGPIFVEAENGKPWRYKGVSAFRLPQLFSEGQDIAPFCQAYAGFNVLRSWLFGIPEATKNQPWDLADRFDVIRAYIAACRSQGFRVALTILPTFPRNDASADVQRIVDRAFDELSDFWETLFIELVNEPDIHLKPDTSRLVVPSTRILWTSGDYVKSAKARGKYGVDHSDRDDDWPEGCHRLMEFYHGGGPHDKSDPPHRFPWIEDEPGKIADAPDGEHHGKTFNRKQDFLAFYAGCGMFGAGATIHHETGKFGLLPTELEREYTAIALRGLDAFPLDAARGPYRRIPGENDASYRAYIKGNCMVRIRPRTVNAPESGWMPLDREGVLWVR